MIKDYVKMIENMNESD
jgi:CheY-specific phosphatase CheX